MSESSNLTRRRVSAALALVVMGCHLASAPSLLRGAPDPQCGAPPGCAAMTSATPDVRASSGLGHSDSQLDAGSRSGDPAVPKDLDASDARCTEVAPGARLASVEVTTERVVHDGERQRPTGAIAAAVADEELQTWNIGGRTDANHVSNRSGYHPGTRVRVDARPRLSAKFLRSRAGTALGQRVVATLRNRGYWPFRNCFEEFARVHPDRGGKTELQLSIDGGGSVRQARLLRTDVKQGSIAQCIAAAARRLRLEPSHFRRLDVDVTIALWPGDVPLLPLEARTNANCKDIEPDSQSVHSIETDVVGCMQAAREKDPKLWGRLALAFTVDPGGHPADISEQYSTFGDADAVRCVVERLQTLAFAPRSPSCSRLIAAWRLQRPGPLNPPARDGGATDTTHAEVAPAKPEPSAGITYGSSTENEREPVPASNDR